MFKPKLSVNRGKSHIELHPARIIIYSFVAGIILGGFLLKLPQAASGGQLSWIDAFFTSTSAICVTGLIVVDTGTYFTMFGQLVILTLIQIGGLGTMVFSTFFILLFVKRLSIGDRFLAKESLLGRISFKNLFSLVVHIIAVTIVLELIGAALLFISFSRVHPVGFAAYSAVFHAISAFCNAGFSLYSLSLMSFSGDILVNLTIAVLIILGGFGFPVLYELLNRLLRRPGWESPRMSLHCKLVLITSGILLLCGVVFLYAFEYLNPSHHDYTGISLLEAFFQSVTARTAGFNTVDIDLLSNPSLFLIIILMFIGGSPASTAGGVKTTSLAVFIALIRARIRGSEQVPVLRRSIPNEAVYKVLSIIVGSIFLIICVNIILQVTEAGFAPHNEVAGTFLITLFETTSAFGTVGLSMGITPSLTVVGKLLIMLTMLIGRIGPLTFAVAFVAKKTKQHFEYPEDSPMLG
ncbi:MAG: TrkH family potassium uptake protein [Candidatus Auribacterota bacterium]|nr:TrkH family potassium uptake protein [Candidatus Auribacterota bacterium]